MIETGTITQIHDDIVVVACRTEACESCSGAFCKTEGRTFEAINGRDIKLQIGDQVEVYLPPGKTVVAGFMVLIVPLIFFGIGYTLAGRFSPNEGMKALIGIISLALGFWLNFSIGKKRKRATLPEVVEVKNPVGVTDPIR